MHIIGVTIDLKDSSGSTPLHYASKYGHLELCKTLISRGCSPITKNASNQTPYDITENHVIRQYLLPLQFQSERQQGNVDTMYGLSSNASYDPYGQGSNIMPASVPNVYPPTHNQQQHPPNQFSGQPPSIPISSPRMSAMPAVSDPSLSSGYPPSNIQPPVAPPSLQLNPPQSIPSVPPPPANPHSPSSYKQQPVSGNMTTNTTPGSSTTSRTIQPGKYIDYLFESYIIQQQSYIIIIP